MGTFLTIILLGAGGGFQAQLGYEPTVMGKEFLLEEPLNLLFPYSAYYLNNRISGKVGFGFDKGWETRMVGGVAQTYMFDGNAPFTVNDWHPSWQFCEWRSCEFSGGAEIGRALRFRTGKGSAFLGAECEWGRYVLEGVFLDFSATNAEDYFNTVQASANGLGWQGYVGLCYPIARFNDRLSLNLTGMLKTGAVRITPHDLPDNAEWGSYTYSQGKVYLPRWGLSAGLCLAYDTRRELDLDALPDARMRPATMRGGCLLRNVDTSRVCLGGCCLTGTSSKAGQAGAAFLLGPGIGIPFAVYGAVMMYDNPTEYEIYPLAIGCYLWSPVGSYIGTMVGGRVFNPGGSWAYTLVGTLLGQAANLFLAEGYRIAVGANPWRGDADLSSMMRGPGKGTYAVIAAASTLPTIGALAGYNLSLKHARQAEIDSTLDTGYQPTWDEQVRRDFAGYRYDPYDPDRVHRTITLVRAEF